MVFCEIKRPNKMERFFYQKNNIDMQVDQRTRLGNTLLTLYQAHDMINIILTNWTNIRKD